MDSKTLGDYKQAEAKLIGLPDWIGRFAKQIYDGELTPKKPQKTLSFDDQWDKEMEEIRNMEL